MKPMTLRLGIALAMSTTLLCSPALAGTLGEIRFEPCVLVNEALASATSAECAHYAVPEDREAPEGRIIELALARVPARSPDPQPDPLLFIAGGPGQSAIQSYALVAPGLQTLLRDRDLILIDQRGTGQSNALRCDEDASADFAAGRARLRENTRACLERLRRFADPAQYSTTQAVADLEAVRRALGAPQLNLIAGSYGTRVALEYLRRHPDGVRSLILDGVVPPQLALGQDHARNLERALGLIFAACREDARCAERYGDPEATLASVRAQLSRRPLRASYPDPVSFAPRSDKLSADVLAAIVRFYAYVPEFSSLMPLLLDEVKRGRAGAVLAQAQGLYENLRGDMAGGMELSVICAEDADLLTPREDDADTVLGNQLIESVKQQCAVWPSSPRPADFHLPVVSDKPVLLLSGGWDPVTPPAYGDLVAETLSNVRHLVARGQGHQVLGRGCLPDLAAEFVETLDAAALDASCLEVLHAPPFFLNYQGPAP